MSFSFLLFNTYRIGMGYVFAVAQFCCSIQSVLGFQIWLQRNSVATAVSMAATLHLHYATRRGIVVGLGLGCWRQP